MIERLNWTELRAITNAFLFSIFMGFFFHISNIGELGFICKTIFRKIWEITIVFFHSLAVVHLCYRYHLFIIFPFQLWLNIKLTIVLNQGRGWLGEVCMEPVFTISINAIQLQYSGFEELICADRVTDLSGMFKVRDEENLRQLSLRTVQWLQKWLL